MSAYSSWLADPTFSRLISTYSSCAMVPAESLFILEPLRLMSDVGERDILEGNWGWGG